MKIYTKTGDDGTTGLFGGTRLPKHHLRIESYGTVDELNAFIGLLRDVITDDNDIRVQLKTIQATLFTIGSHLAADPNKENLWLPAIETKHVFDLETAIDEMDGELPALKNFILPGGHTTVSYCHICRCVCRRAERQVIALSEQESVSPVLFQYLNRLSDYFFVLARYIGKQLNAEEIVWTAR